MNRKTDFFHTRLCLFSALLTLHIFGAIADANQKSSEMAKRMVVKQKLLPTSVWRASARRVYSRSVLSLRFSPNCLTLASAGTIIKKAKVGLMPIPLLRVEMIDTQSLHVVKTLPLLPAANFVVFSPDLKRIVTNPSVYQGLQLFDAINGKSLWQQYTQLPNYPAHPYGASSSDGVSSLAISPRGDKIIYSLHASGAISWAEWWFLGTRELTSGTDGNDATWFAVISSLAFSPDSRSFVVGGLDNTLLLYDTKTFKVLWEQGKQAKDDGSRSINAITFSPDGKTIATGNFNNLVYLRDAKDGQLLRTIPVHLSSVQHVVFSPDGTVLASGSQDGTVALSSTRNGKSLNLWKSKHGSVTALAFAPNGLHFASGYQDGTIAVWSRR